MQPPPADPLALPRQSLSRGQVLLYFIVALALGMEGAFFLSEVPYLMRISALSVESIGWLSALATLPYIIQPFVNPITHMFIRQRTWIVVTCVLCAISSILAVSFLCMNHIYWFYAATVLGQVLYGLGNSCYSGLAAMTLDREGRLKASNLLNLGAQAGGAFAATVFLFVTERRWFYALSALLAGLFLLPALAALLLPEPEHDSRPRAVLGLAHREIWQVLRDKENRLGLVLCLCPAGTLALNAFLPALAVDYRAPAWMVIGLNGFAGWLLAMLGIYVGGVLCLRFYSPAVYSLSAVLMAACGLCLAGLPVGPSSYLVCVAVYYTVQGIALAACSAMIFELISRASALASTQYSVFYACVSLAQMAVLALDTKAYAWRGLGGLYLTDMALNLVGAGLLILLMYRWRLHQHRRSPPLAAVPEAAADLVAER